MKLDGGSVSDMIFTDIHIAGHPVVVEAQKKAFAAWLAPGEKASYHKLAARIEEFAPASAPEGKAPPFDRAAGRIVQKLRKAGLVELVGRAWRLTGEGEKMRSEILSQPH